MKSSLPKVLHTLAGKPMVQHVVDSATELNATGIHIVVGHGAEKVESHFAGQPVSMVLQQEQLGTGHAVTQALPNIDPQGITLILYGDVPLVSVPSLQKLLAEVSEKSIGLMTAYPEDPNGYGRIVRDYQGRVSAIIEQKDANEDQLSIREVNTGILAAPSASLHKWLPALSNDNAQGEYYLTDIIAMAAHDNMDIRAVQPQALEETLGVNDRVQLAYLERYYQYQQAVKLMVNGASLADPERIDVRGIVTTGRDVSLDINVVFEGKVELGDNIVVGPNCVLKDCRIASGTRIEAFSHIDGADIGQDCQIGPYARVRPGTQLDTGAKLGNFVETKKAVIGKGSKVNHLTYIGDAEMGDGVNVGAGTITCNYDGANKFKTVMGDNVFVGSNSTLVAPLNLASGSFVGAGSVITKDSDPETLVIGRAKQVTITKWKRPVKDNK